MIEYIYANPVRRGLVAEPAGAPPFQGWGTDTVCCASRVIQVSPPRLKPWGTLTILKAIKWPVARWALDYLRQTDPSWLERLVDRQPNGKTATRFWQRGGGYDRNVRSYETLAHMIEYIYANPVRRGLVAEPAAWEWSSARWYDGRRDVPLAMDDGVF